jgi:hypothetical protein
MLALIVNVGVRVRIRVRAKVKLSKIDYFSPISANADLRVT